MNHKRPVNMDLASMRFPITAIASILHRLSGIGMFLLLPLALYMLCMSLHSRASFDDLQTMLTSHIMKFGLWFFLSCLAYHVFAGIRHMILDLGIGEGIHASKRSAFLIIVISLVATIFLGVWIWCPM